LRALSLSLARGFQASKYTYQGEKKVRDLEEKLEVGKKFAK